MRGFLTPKAVAAYAALAALAALSACSDTTAPRSLRTAGAASFIVGPTPNVGPVQLTLNSSTATQLCGAVQPALVGPFTAADPFADGACVAATDLMPALATYNPGWDAPLGASIWIGSQALANQYTVKPGTYKLNTSFNIPAGVTSPVINVNTLSDNLVAVYLNNVLLGRQALQDCVTAPCNWQTANTFTTSTNATFNIGGANTLQIYLIDTPIGLGKAASSPPIYRCAIEGPQQFGEAGFPNPKNFNVLTPQYTQYHSTPPTWDPNVCLNPAGLDFVATVSWVVPPPPPICDFITFGRLVLDVGGEKVVISGNAGGNAPDGGILGEIQISIGNTDYHVHTIDSYGPTTNPPLFPDQYARVITGKSGTHTVELRLRDDPNPGQGEPGTQEGDKVWLKIDGVVVVPTQTLDKGNIQLHLNCRGPNG